MNRAERLRELQPVASLPEVLAFYDLLPPIGPQEMLGEWKGEEIATGHAFDGLLGPSGWWGKCFRSIDDVDPLIFERAGKRFAGNPALMPLGLIGHVPGLAKSAPAAAAFRLLSPLLRTRRPRARLRTITYRGVASTAMVYDALPIIDCFRSVDSETLIGAMDIRGHSTPFFFTLRRA